MQVPIQAGHVPRISDRVSLVLNQLNPSKEKTMKLPKQSAPVVRLAAPSAKSCEGGVEASSWLSRNSDWIVPTITAIAAAV
jgi:hypothetical protein